jgi:murein DD-endopeptidase MepM/ murein hydrolase activator NlpD
MLRFLATVFRERELILRSQGRVYFLRLTSGLQVFILFLVGSVVLWGAGMTVASIVQGGVIGIKNDEIREARVGYESLFKEALGSLGQLEKITQSIRSNQQVLVSRLAGDGKAGSGEPLKNKLTEIEAKAKKMTQAKSVLVKSLDKIKFEFAMAEDQRTQIIATRAALRDRVSELENQLRGTKSLATKLDKEVGSLSSDLTQSREKQKETIKQRKDLLSKVKVLEKGLELAMVDQQAAEKDLKNVLGQLAKAAGEPQKSAANQKPLREQTVALLNRLSVLHSAHENVLERLSERAVGNIEEAEKLIAMTGINVATILKYVTPSTANQGGPLVPASGAGQLAGGLSGTVMNVDSKLGRWGALRKVLGIMPLMAPLDFYHLASKYGLRRDPFSKKRAMHYGVDLAGWTNASVYSTAPGKVVFAGRKGRYGKLIEIDHGFGLRTRYAHLRKISVKTGQQIVHRQKIGVLGSSGRSTGPHVHYEIRFEGKPLNPRKFIMAGRYVFKG